MRHIPFEKYDRFLWRQLTEAECSELSALRAECQLAFIATAGSGNADDAGTYMEEMQYIDSIFENMHNM